MSKFKVGDKARVRKDLEHGLYGHNCLRFHRDMDYLKGQIITIDKIDEDGDYYNETHNYYFNDEMLEEVKEKQIKIMEAEITNSIKGEVKNLVLNDKYSANVKLYKSYAWYRNENIITCIIKCNGHKGIGIAKCHPGDEFKLNFGGKLAEFRAESDLYKNIAEDM